MEIPLTGDTPFDVKITMEKREPKKDWAWKITDTQDMHYPNSKFDPFDPHHVTLQLLQEIHSQRIQMQIDRNSERDKRRSEITDHAITRDRLKSAQDAHGNSERECTALRDILIEISKGRSKAADSAADILKLWPRSDPNMAD